MRVAQLWKFTLYTIHKAKVFSVVKLVPLCKYVCNVHVDSVYKLPHVLAWQPQISWVTSHALAVIQLITATSSRVQ